MKNENKGSVKIIPATADFAIITAIPEEFKAVKKILRLKLDKGKNRFYSYGWVRSLSGDKYFVVCAQCRKPGNNSSHSLTDDILARWKPKYLLMVGIAGGVKGRENIVLGDVVVHNNLVYYELVKETNRGEEERTLDLQPRSVFLSDTAEFIVQKCVPWWDKIDALRPDANNNSNIPKVVFGEILSGDKLFGNPKSNLLEQLLIKHPKAIAMDMESAGIANALWQHSSDYHVEFLIVRGISDFCNEDDNQKTRERWKPYAAQASAAFARELIRNTSAKQEAEVLSYISNYNELLEKKIQKVFPELQDKFSLNIKLASGEKKTGEFLLEEIADKRRVVLRGQAGSGKSTILGELARALVRNNNTIPVFIDLKDWKDENSHALEKSEDDAAALIDDFDILLRCSIEDLSASELQKFPAEYDRWILVDALNEVHGETAVRKIINILDEYVHQMVPHPNVIVTDRMNSLIHYGSKWEIIEVNSLDKNVVQEKVEIRFGKNTYNSLSDKSKKLLATPYFLDRVLKIGSLKVGSAAEIIQSFFTDRLKIDEETLDLIAKSAFYMYKTYRSSSFEEDKFKEMIGNQTYETLLKADIVKKSEKEEGYIHFEHELTHDYLASRYLVRHENWWDDVSFDAVSFESNSCDSLSMTLEQITASAKGEKFLKLVYDWNWLAAVTCLEETWDKKPFTMEIETAILAAVSEKLFDPMNWTQENAKKVLNRFPQEIIRRFQVEDLQSLVNSISNDNSKENWFLKWKGLFSHLPGSSLNEKEIMMVIDEDSILGWTASNVIRRLGMNENGLVQLRTIYSTLKEMTDFKSKTIRWRVVHTLGAFDSKENIELLFSALDNDTYFWARYGAVRSLVEIAAKTNNVQLSEEVLAGLESRLRNLPPKIMEEMGLAMFYKNAPNSWISQATPLMEKARDIQQSNTGKDRWNEILQKFKDFWKRITNEKNSGISN